ncbi:MAG: hypothetical protein GQ565_13280 [Candidatus Aegiribacteria sp.]|nr:hypothetical protein [Candidatus Aegiribacteria sp.]
MKYSLSIFGTLHTQCRWGTDLKSSSSRKIARSNDFLFEQDAIVYAVQRATWHCDMP